MQKVYESRNRHTGHFGVIGRLLIVYISTVIMMLIVLVSLGVPNVGCVLSVNEPTKLNTIQLNCTAVAVLSMVYVEASRNGLDASSEPGIVE
jgi:hypothetical protein